MDYDEVAYKELNDFHTIAFIIVNELDMKTYRDALKPHRGEIA
ncbi:hypothetical protein [Tenacibaculum sp. nBUS_03]